ncbi:MAG: catalase/peroxidase HPI [Sulfurovum sp.]|nr:catalase/peroxidase HPI [Sulfurovum sp.]
MKQTTTCLYNKEDFKYTTLGGDMIAKWWPNKLNLKILQQNNAAIDPTKENDSYAKSFAKLDMEALKNDLKRVMRTSQEWWPADYGHYGPFFIRMAWHSAGTYRLVDGRGGASGGNQRFAPVNSWPDNANLDKARRLLWPVKKKYGDKISWADMMILSGNVAMEDMGFKIYGFGGGREDIWEAELDTYWGSETEWLADERHTEKGKIKNSLAAVQMGLIYVNPEGPDGQPDVLGAAKQIRDSFQRMGMSDEETIALIAGGHTFGKNHGAADPSKYVGAEPEAAPIEEQGLGWKNSYGEGKGKDTITSGLEGAWTPTPTKWDNSFLRILFKYEWNLQKSPAGAWQWVAIDPDEEDMAPDAHEAGKTHAPIMLTTDLALRQDPEFAKISKRFLEDHALFEEAFAKAWFKLTHRDMGPKSRYLGDEVPKEDFIWQDPIPPVDDPLIDDDDIETLKTKILAKASISDLVYTAWSAASTYRNTDKRGGANGARIALQPQCDWEVNRCYVPEVLEVLRKIQEEFNTQQPDGKSVSLADLIVLGGTAAVEKAIENGGINIQVPFHPGRNDATQELTDTHTFRFLEPVADGFRNYLYSGCDLVEEQLLIEKSVQLGLNVHEMSVLVAGMRALDAVYEREHNTLVDEKERLDNSFFVNLLDMDIAWKKEQEDRELYRGVDRSSGDTIHYATRVDLVFGSNSELRAQAEYYAQDDKKERFVEDFVHAWVKVMELDRFDLK